MGDSRIQLLLLCHFTDSLSLTTFLIIKNVWKISIEGLIHNTWSVILKTVKVSKNKESTQWLHSLEGYSLSLGLFMEPSLQPCLNVQFSHWQKSAMVHSLEPHLTRSIYGTQPTFPPNCRVQPMAPPSQGAQPAMHSDNDCGSLWRAIPDCKVQSEVPPN